MASWKTERWCETRETVRVSSGRLKPKTENTEGLSALCA